VSTLMHGNWQNQDALRPSQSTSTRALDSDVRIPADRYIKPGREATSPSERPGQHAPIPAQNVSNDGIRTWSGDVELERADDVMQPAPPPRVDRIGLTSLTATLPRAGHQLGRHAGNRFSGCQEIGLEATRNVATVFNGKRRALQRQHTAVPADARQS
jgi:hypothetical protein